MSAHDRWLAGYRRSTATAWCPNPDCGNHDGRTVDIETEYGQSWATPEECDRCGATWTWDPPDDDDGVST